MPTHLDPCPATGDSHGLASDGVSCPACLTQVRPYGERRVVGELVTGHVHLTEDLGLLDVAGRVTGMTRPPDGSTRVVSTKQNGDETIWRAERLCRCRKGEAECGRP